MDVISVMCVGMSCVGDLTGIFFIDLRVICMIWVRIFFSITGSKHVGSDKNI